MGKVKQAIQEVQEIVYGNSNGRTSKIHETITLPDVQTLLFKKHWHER